MLTERQNAVVDFLKETHARTGLLPTTREIQEHLGYKSQTSVQDILEALERKGVLERKPGRAQPWTMSAFTNRPQTIEVPLYGSIAAGLPVHQEQENDSCIIIDIETLKIPNNTRTFALKVRGIP
jgi:repressor LexA